MKDSKNLLLLLVSVALTATWVYHLYDKSHYSKHSLEVLVKDTLATQQAIKDSLQKLFDQKTAELDTTKIKEDSLKGTLDSTLLKIYELKVQISGILKNRSATKADLKKARELIGEYKEQIEELQAQNNNLETERSRLNGVLTELNDQVKGLQDNIQKMTKQNKELTEMVNAASLFVASDVCLSIVTVRSDKNETEATSSRKADKLIFSFTLQNNIVQNSSYSVYVVITQPDNKVLQTDVWGSNYFVTKDGGNKAYTAKIPFDYTKGEQKKIVYTIQPDNFYRGTYTMQIFQNGILIGEKTKQLD